MGRKKVSTQLKWQIISLLKDKTKTQRDIAKILGVSQKCVHTTKKNFSMTSRVDNLKRPGRTPILTPRDETYIFRQIRKRPSTSYRQLAADFNSKFENIRISKDTVSRVLLKK